MIAKIKAWVTRFRWALAMGRGDIAYYAIILTDIKNTGEGYTYQYQERANLNTDSAEIVSGHIERDLVERVEQNMFLDFAKGEVK